jgi:rubrerythrin
MKTPSDVGMNRTGLLTHPLNAKEMVRGAEESVPSSPGDETGIAAERIRYAREAEPLGKVPPPPTMKGMAKTAMKLLQGAKVSLFVDKLSERLAFERSGTRLYEVALSKLDAYGTWEGGPTREGLLAIRDEEMSHAQLVRECIEKLGADPTVMSPSADFYAVATEGVPKMLLDPRTTMRQTLEGLLLAELTDNAGWETLIRLAEGFGQEQMANAFRTALAREGEHLVNVRAWLGAGLDKEAGAGAEVPPSRPSASTTPVMP